jgi:hypothetical protein
MNKYSLENLRGRDSNCSIVLAAEVSNVSEFLLEQNKNIAFGEQKQSEMEL